MAFRVKQTFIKIRNSHLGSNKHQDMILALFLLTQILTFSLKLVTKTIPQTKVMQYKNLQCNKLVLKQKTKVSKLSTLLMLPSMANQLSSNALKLVRELLPLLHLLKVPTEAFKSLLKGTQVKLKQLIQLRSKVGKRVSIQLQVAQ